MMMRFMMNTDTCIYLKNRRPAKIAEKFAQLKWGEVVMSVITYGELCNGALKSNQPQAALRNTQFLSKRIPVQPITKDVAEVYARIRSSLEKQGAIIGGNDLWIAAHALALNVTLITNNTREFKRVNGLKIENWVV